jgi:hypothetical protein
MRVAGRDALPGDLYARWSTFINAPRRSQPIQGRVASDVEMKCRLRDEEPTARKWRLDIFALVPRYRRAGAPSRESGSG